MPTGAKELLANGSWFWLIVLKHGSKLDSMLLDNIKAVQLNLNFRKTMDKQILYYIFQLILKKGTLTLKKKMYSLWIWNSKLTGGPLFLSAKSGSLRVYKEILSFVVSNVQSETWACYSSVTGHKSDSWCHNVIQEHTYVFLRRQEYGHIKYGFDPFLKIIYKKIKTLHMLSNMALRVRSRLELVAEAAQPTSTGCWDLDYSEWFLEEKALLSILLRLDFQMLQCFAIVVFQLTKKVSSRIKAAWMLCPTLLLTFSSWKPRHPPPPT